MHQFRRYAETLKGLTLEYSAAPTSVDLKARVEQALDGEAGRTLFGKVPVDVLRRNGAFFSRSELADKLADRVSPWLRGSASVLDPACGAGDLLLACARRFPVHRDLERTLSEWGRRLHGFDIHVEFVLAAKARLALLAMARGASVSSGGLSVAEFFPHIRQLDFLEVDSLKETPACLVTNPPFQASPAPKGCSWASGAVTKAAIFVAKCCDLTPVGSAIAALLPDVLRSGSRYSSWRAIIESAAAPRSIEPLGVFNAKADVDVFLTTFVRRARTSMPRRRHWLPPQAQRLTGPTLSSICDVRVGPVVPFRDPNEGPVRAYVTTASLPRWSSCRPAVRRLYNGPTFKPPFVVVRRTSRQTNKERAVVTLVVGRRRVAVENHLLVLLPKKQTRSECEYIIRILKDRRTTQWLNARICCRHLTTSSLNDLPLWKDK